MIAFQCIFHLQKSLKVFCDIMHDPMDGSLAVLLSIHTTVQEADCHGLAAAILVFTDASW